LLAFLSLAGLIGIGCVIGKLRRVSREVGQILDEVRDDLDAVVEATREPRVVAGDDLVWQLFEAGRRRDWDTYLNEQRLPGERAS
jgi:hypothetical protein